MRFEISPEVVQNSMRRSRSHFSGRGNTYNEDWFPTVGNNEEFEPISLEDLRSDKRAGIYLIKQTDLNKAYVGLAADFSGRFFNGKGDCKANCPPNCACYGHINSTPNTCRSHRIIESGNKFDVYCLTEMDYEIQRVCQAEIDWYYILLELGYEMVNADWALGVAGFNGRPIVSLDLREQEYLFFLTITEGHQSLHPGRQNDAISPIVRGFQNQLGGYTHRYATEEEVERFQRRRRITELVSEINRASEWRDDALRLRGEIEKLCPGCNGKSTTHKRNLRLDWSEGPLSSVEIQHLLNNMRGDYSDAVPVSEYKAINWHSSSGGWQCRAQKGVSSKELWQTGPLKAWLNHHDAALHRERKILTKRWQEFNTGKNGSNADLLNQNLSLEERDNEIFEDWE